MVHGRLTFMACLQGIKEDLASDDWETTGRGLTSLCRLAVHHAEACRSFM